MLNLTDIFKSKAFIQQRNDIKSMEALKKKRQKDFKNQQLAEERIKKKGQDLAIHNASQFNTEEVKILVRQKLGAVPAQKKGDLVIKYSKANPPKIALPWSEAGEERLRKLKESDIEVRDTAIVVAANQNARALVNNVTQLDQSNHDALLKALQGTPTSEESSGNTIQSFMLLITCLH